jgi:cell division septation protein DedD
MAERDEKELVLGNKQLISLFFLAVALCGVFFALGYMIGHNSSKGSITSLDTPAAPASEAAARPATEAPVTEAAAPVPATLDPAPQEGQIYTQPARDTTPAPVATATAPAVLRVVAPETGATYIQVTALRQADATNLVKTLREQSLPAILADSSKTDLFRVLVGPYHQTADVAEAKAKLKALGFANAFVQKQ